MEIVCNAVKAQSVDRKNYVRGAIIVSCNYTVNGHGLRFFESPHPALFSRERARKAAVHARVEYNVASFLLDQRENQFLALSCP